MRIAQVSPLYESVPPKLSGGTERVVAYLTDELVAQGHDVTLFASGDSRTSARLVAIRRSALRLDHEVRDAVAHHLCLVDEVFRRAPDFDIIHFHLDHLHLPLAARMRVPHVTTMHGRLDLPDLAPLFGRFSDAPLVSISDAQRGPLPFANWVATVYHGLPARELAPCQGQGRYLAFLGRVSPEKGVDRAIEIALRVQIPLRIAAKVDRADRAYFERAIRPLLAHPLIEFVGEIPEAEKARFLGEALALLFPIDWPEPFGLVMIEAMACGTPVVAFRRGSVSEVMKDAVSGFVVDTVDEAVAAVRRVPTLDRGRCRAYFESRFLASHMAHAYVRAYREVLRTARGDPQRPRLVGPKVGSAA
jgi:glycosyltransferase involved in cell wall biosynthesis